MASITIDDTPTRMRQGAGRHPRPVALLARLDRPRTSWTWRRFPQRRDQSKQLGTEIGCRGLLVHAETLETRAFYLHLIPEFEQSPTDELHLLLLMKDILTTLAE